MFHAASKVMKMAIIILFCFFTVTNAAMVKINDCCCLHFQAALAQCCIAFIVKNSLSCFAFSLYPVPNAAMQMAEKGMCAFAFILKLLWGWHWVPSYVPCCITLGMKEYEDDNLYYVLLFTFTGKKEWVLFPSFWGCIEPALCQSLVPSFVPCCFTLGIREYEALPCFAASLNECFCLHFEAAWAGLGVVGPAPPSQHRLHVASTASTTAGAGLYITNP